jgi:abortive infection bacteriophage resistance protein
MRYAKPFLSVPQQIALLRQRGLQITDEPKAEAYLRRIGYYRLSGYWYPFRKSTQQNGQTVVLDDIRPGVDFGTVVDLYVFDKRLRLLMLDALERIEVALRSSIALLLGQYDPWAHRDPQYLHGQFAKKNDPRYGRPRHQEWLARVDSSFQSSKEDFVKHFKSKYAPDMPPIWIAVELWDFGTMSVLFEGMAHKDKTAIAAEYGVPDPIVMESWIRSLNYVRNLCAHHARLWNRPLVLFPKFPQRGAIPALDHIGQDRHAQTRLYGAAAICQYLIQQVSPNSQWGVRFGELISALPPHPMIDLGSASGFPQGWNQENLWR